MEINRCFESALRSSENDLLIKVQDPRQFASANFRLPKICCQSADPKNYVDLRPQADESTVHTSLVWAAALRPGSA